jgi:hypothetical protein
MEPPGSSEDELLERLEIPEERTQCDEQKATATHEESVKNRAVLDLSYARGRLSV